MITNKHLPALQASALRPVQQMARPVGPRTRNLIPTQGPNTRPTDSKTAVKGRSRVGGNRLEIRSEIGTRLQSWTGRAAWPRLAQRTPFRLHRQPCGGLGGEAIDGARFENTLRPAMQINVELNGVGIARPEVPCFDAAQHESLEGGELA